MKATMNIRHSILILFVIACLQPSGCGFRNRNQAAHRFESYGFNQNSPLVSRVSTPPEFLVSYLKKNGQTRRLPVVYPDRKRNEDYRTIPGITAAAPQTPAVKKIDRNLFYNELSWQWTYRLDS